MQVQYITDEQSRRTGVLLDVAVYQRLINQRPVDPDLLTEMSRAEFEALAVSRLALAAQARLDSLLNLQQEGLLGEEEIRELDELLAQVDQLTLLKTRARYTLSQVGEDA